MTEPRLRIDVLGPVRVRVDDAELPLGGPRPRAVFAQLAIQPNRVVSTETLAMGTWNNDPPPDARANLQVFVHNLRKSLRLAGLDARSVLATAAPGYRLVIPDDAIDLGRFNAHKRRGLACSADHRFAEAATEFSAALAEFSGPVLDDLRGLEFAELFATALQEERLTVLTCRAEAEIASGRAATVVPDLMAAAAQHPLREPLWVQLITALYLNGQQSDALGACRRVRETLADELGVDPGKELQDLEQRILRQEPLTVAESGWATAARAMTIIDERATRRAAVLRDDLTGQSYRLGPGTSIGRLPDNDIVLAHPKVSRHHAVIVDTGRSFVIRDLASSNGVFVRDERVVDHAEIVDGDSIRIGATALTLVVESE